MMSLAANQSWKGHSCGLVLKLLHSWARWVRSWQGGPVWLGANICPKHPVWPCELSLAVGKLSHLAQVSGVPWKGASENGILFSHCSSLNVLSHGGPGRGENWTRTGQVQKTQPLSWPHVSMKFTSPLWPPRGEEKQSRAGPVPICCHLHHLCTSSGPEHQAIPSSHCYSVPSSSGGVWNMCLVFRTSANTLWAFWVVHLCNQQRYTEGLLCARKQTRCQKHQDEWVDSLTGTRNNHTC